MDLDDRHITYMLYGLKSLAMHWAEFENLTMKDVGKICVMHDSIEDYINKRIAEMDKEPDIPETLKREPNKGERTVLGKKEYVKPGKVNASSSS
jgi:hypothetical protein